MKIIPQEIWAKNKPELVEMVLELREQTAVLEARIETLQVEHDHYAFTLNVITTALFDPDSLAKPEDYAPVPDRESDDISATSMGGDS